MCGINGIFNFSGVNLDISPELLEGMNKLVIHRGPDDGGVWVSDMRKIGLGHRRLSILDLSSAGHQPMLSPSGNTIVFNGEIYNYQEIKKELNVKKYISETDTEVLLHSYDRCGIRMLERLNGMFSFAIWDSKKEQLFLARDRIGIKPLYYTISNGVFAFASEIRSLLSLPWVHAQLDEEALYHFLTFNKVYPPHTMFAGIHKFHPGHMMVVDCSGIKRYEKFWEVTYSNYDGLSLDESAEILTKELKASVNRRMVSDVPVGAFLSGGVDSSAITAYMSEHTDYQINTYSIGFEDAPDFTELEWARKVSKKYGTNHIEKIVTPLEIRDSLPAMVEIFDEPLADATSIPIHFISQLAQENGTKVVLTGDGSDELFLGYSNWMRYIRYQPFFDSFSKFPKVVKSAASYSCNAISPSSAFSELLDRAAKNQHMFWGGASGFKENTKQTLLSNSFQKKMQDISSEKYLTDCRFLFDSLPKNGKKTDYVDWLSFYGLKSIIPNYYLYRADRIGMANSIELRTPFLDHNLVNAALSFRSEYKVMNGIPKHILKYALEGTLDKNILYRKKMGFCVPVKDWASDVVLEYLDEHVEKFCRDTDLFNIVFLKHSMNSIRSGSQKYAFALWNIYFFINWYKRWLL